MTASLTGEVEAFLASYSLEVQTIAVRLRHLVLEIVPDTASVTNRRFA